jgi:hypothetical protein
MKRLLLLFCVGCCTALPSFAQSEVPLNVSPMVTNFSDYLNQADLFKERYTGLENFHTIQRERVMYSSLLQAIDRTSGDHSNEYISGMRLYYGLTLTNQIIYYYVPLFANEVRREQDRAVFEVQQPAGGFEGVLRDPSYDIYYAYNGELYDLRDDGIEFEDAPDNVNRYRMFVQTKRGYAMNAVESVFIPSQEIRALYQDNRNTDYNTGSIYLTSTAIFENGGYNHSVIMTTIRTYPEPYQTNSNFAGMAADMVKRCPDECLLVTYPVLSSEKK